VNSYEETPASMSNFDKEKRFYEYIMMNVNEQGYIRPRFLLSLELEEGWGGGGNAIDKIKVPYDLI
jgi:hypothetical protein